MKAFSNNLTSILFSLSLTFSYISIAYGAGSNISYDGRAILIDGQRTMLFAGSIHYPRSTPGMWPSLFVKSKAAGINIIDTYVFWNLHEPRQGVYDFETDSANLPLFLELAAEYGLYVNLRIGPYICAEWTFGGLPFWLLHIPGIETRTFNKPYIKIMESFVTKVVEVTRPYIRSSESPKAPIIMIQIENEYGAVQSEYGHMGSVYKEWAIQLAFSYKLDIPVVMCLQDDLSTHYDRKPISTCNGFYCDNWIRDHKNRFPTEPPMLMELWTGWFQHWASPKPVRPVRDLAFSAARFIARGGCYVGYYMWHGGTNFGYSGSSYKTTSYDYDAPLNEYGIENEPKYSHLAQFHHVIMEYQDVILNSQRENYLVEGDAEIHVYDSDRSRFVEGRGRAIAFFSNWHVHEKEFLSPLTGEKFTVPSWSVTIYTRSSSVGAGGEYKWAYCTATLAEVTDFQKKEFENTDSAVILQRSIILQNGTTGKSSLSKGRGKYQWRSPSKVVWKVEPVGGSKKGVIRLEIPNEVTRLTNGTTDYVWYSTTLNPPESLLGPLELHFENIQDVGVVFVNGIFTSVLDEASKSSRFDYSTKHPYMFVIPESAASSPVEVHLLVRSLGYPNFGANLENTKKGVLGTVRWCETDVSSNGWNHSIGLSGNLDGDWNLPISMDTPLMAQPTSWYRISFPAPTSAAKLHHAVINLSAMTRGQIWLIKGNIDHVDSILANRGADEVSFEDTEIQQHLFNVGRYNLLTASEAKLCSENRGYIGTYYSSKCSVGGDEASQSKYHIPADWIRESLDMAYLTRRGSSSVVWTDMKGKVEDGGEEEDEEEEGEEEDIIFTSRPLDGMVHLLLFEEVGVQGALNDVSIGYFYL